MGTSSITAATAAVHGCTRAALRRYVCELQRHHPASTCRDSAAAESADIVVKSMYGRVTCYESRRHTEVSCFTVCSAHSEQVRCIGHRADDYRTSKRNAAARRHAADDGLAAVWWHAADDGHTAERDAAVGLQSTSNEHAAVCRHAADDRHTAGRWVAAVGWQSTSNERTADHGHAAVWWHAAD